MDFSKLRVPAVNGMSDEEIFEWWRNLKLKPIGPGARLALLVIAVFPGRGNDKLIKFASAKGEKQMKRFVQPLIDEGLVSCPTT